MDAYENILQLREFFQTFHVSGELLEFLIQPQKNGETHKQQYKVLLETIRKMSLQIRECEETIASFQSAVIQSDDLKNVQLASIKTEIQTHVSNNSDLALEISRISEELVECKRDRQTKIVKMAEEYNNLKLENKRMQEDASNNSSSTLEIIRISEELLECKRDTERKVAEMAEEYNKLLLENKRMQEEFMAHKEETAKINNSKNTKLPEKVNYLAQQNNRTDAKSMEYRTGNNNRDNQNEMPQINAELKKNKEKYDSLLLENIKETAILKEKNRKLVGIKNYLIEGIKKNNKESNILGESQRPIKNNNNLELKYRECEDFEELVNDYQIQDQSSVKACIKEEIGKYEIKLT